MQTGILTAKVSIASVQGWHSFTYVSRDPIDEATAKELQREAGYDPRGYGFERFKCAVTEEGSFHASWVCSNSCD